MQVYRRKLMVICHVMIQLYERYFFLIMLIIYLNDLRSRVYVEFSYLKLSFSSPLFAIIQRCQPDLKSKYEDDFQMSLKDYTKWYVIEEIFASV
jgi:hypothetical protein